MHWLCCALYSQTRAFCSAQQLYHACYVEILFSCLTILVSGCVVLTMQRGAMFMMLWPKSKFGSGMSDVTTELCVWLVVEKLYITQNTTRVICLRYEIRQKWLERVICSKVVLKRLLFWSLWQQSRKRGFIWSSQDLKRVPFSPLVTTHKDPRDISVGAGTAGTCTVPRGSRTAQLHVLVGCFAQLQSWID
jgi:hypothetical protein